MPELESAVHENSRNGQDPVEDRNDDPRTISDALAEAHSSAERRDIFARYLEENEREFDADCKKVAKLLERNDVDGLIEHGSRFVPERAAARVAAIRAGQ